MVAEPVVNPDTIPLAEPIDTVEEALLVQVPPVVALESVEELPTVSDVTPEIAAGVALTVMVAVLKHPAPK